MQQRGNKKIRGHSIRLVSIKNRHFSHRIFVTGYIVISDIITIENGKALGSSTG